MLTRCSFSQPKAQPEFLKASCTLKGCVHLAEAQACTPKPEAASQHQRSLGWRDDIRGVGTWREKALAGKGRDSSSLAVWWWWWWCRSTEKKLNVVGESWGGNLNWLVRVFRRIRADRML